MALVVAGAIAAPAAMAAPSIADLRAQVARIQGEVAAIDNQVEAAAEAYNGAVYRLDQIQARIAENRETLRKATRNLRYARAALARRISAAYREPPPTRLQIILSQRSLTGMLGSVEAMERASAQDGAIIRGIQELRARTIKARAALERDRAQAKQEVASRAHQRDVVAGLLRRRRAVLAGAQGRLGRMLAEQRAREARAAALAKQQALARIAASRAPSAPATALTSPVAPQISGGGGGSASNGQAAQIALRYLGVPYRWGGSSPSGFDCSGLASYAYAQVGKSVPHFTGAIWSAFPRVTGPLAPGDLVFFNGLGHMGIYIGGGQFVHAPHTGDVVRVASLSSRGDYVGAVRP